jgi:GNAT superfamily N-acetyltransferase
MIYKQQPLLEMKHRFREIWKASGAVRSWADYKLQLLASADAGYHLYYAEEEGRITATLGFQIKKNALLKEEILKVGIDPEEVQMVRSLIYTHPDYRGQGIGSKLKALADEIAYAAGFRFRMTNGYETKEIYDWAMRNKGVIDLKVKGKEYPSILIPMLG